MTLAVAMPTAAELMTRALEKYNPLQPRDDEGQWTDGMPDDVVSSALKVMGGTVTASARRSGGGKATLSTNGRSVDLDSRELNEFRKMTIDAQYGDEDRAGPDGVFRLVRNTMGDDGKVKSEILVSLRPVEGKFISETGKKFSSLDEAPDDEEHYSAEFDMVIGEGNDGEFGDYPMTRVSLKDLDADENNLKGIYSALERATAARGIDTGNGPTDVFSPRGGVVGFRMKDDNGDPTEVTFNAGEARRLKAAIDEVLYGEDEGVDDLGVPRDDRVTFQTSGGPVEVRFKGRVINNEWEGTLTLFPDSAPWSVAVDGPSIDEFVSAFQESGIMAGIRSFESVDPPPESFNRYDLGVHSMPLARSLEAFQVISPSRAVQLMMLARTVEAADSFLRRGRRVSVERGARGRFGHGIGGAIADAVKAVADTDAPKKRGGRQSAVAKAMASGNANALGGFDRETLRREARRRGLEIAPGTHIDVIRDMLWDSEPSGMPDAEKRRRSLLDVTSFADAGLTHGELAKLNMERMPMDQLRELARDEGVDGVEEMGRDELMAGITGPPLRLGVDIPVISTTDRMAAEKRAVRPKTAEQMRERAQDLLSNMPDDLNERRRIHTEVGGLILDADRAEATERGNAKKGTLDQLRAMKANPASGDRDRVMALIGPMKHAELDQVAKDLGIDNIKGTKLQKQQRLERALVGAELDRRAIMNVSMDTGRPPATEEEAASYFARLAGGFKANMEADRQRALAKKAAVTEPEAPKPRQRAARKPKPSANDFVERAAAISGDPDIWGKLRAAHAEDDAKRAASGGVSGITDRLASASTRAEAQAALGGLKVAALRAVAAQLGMRGVRSLGKDDLTSSIVEFTVGNRINSAAIRAL